MADPIVKNWRQDGEIYLWTYKENTKNYPGWHFTAEKQACLSLIELIGLIKAAKWPSTVGIRISSPTDDILKVPNNRGGKAKWLSAKTLKLRYSNDDIKSDCLSLFFDSMKNQLEMVVGRDRIDEVKDGVHDVYNGVGDYAIKIQDGQQKNSGLWFWWNDLGGGP